MNVNTLYLNILYLKYCKAIDIDHSLKLRYPRSYYTVTIRMSLKKLEGDGEADVEDGRRRARK